MTKTKLRVCSSVAAGRGHRAGLDVLGSKTQNLRNFTNHVQICVPTEGGCVDVEIGKKAAANANKQ